uniref:RING-type E3 ubiquitin transferase n=1 Tax=Geospiza parvula TaxID=87175 RepID=A0A8U8C2F4_GEOPR
MAGGAKEGTGDSGSAAGAGPLKAAVGSECPICLGTVRKPAFVAYCMHQFCFRCIRHWARAREDCPVCRQSLEQKGEPTYP